VPESQYRLVRSRVEQEVLVLAIAEPQLERDALLESLRRELIAAVDPPRVKKVVLDFQRVKSFSSAAFRPLISLRRKLEETGSQLVLCNLSPVVAKTFQATRMISSSRSSSASFAVQPDVASAIASLNSPPEQE
jgi:anti-anti-sigma factor